MIKKSTVWEKLPESTRVKVAGSMLKAGVPFNKVDRFHDLLDSFSSQPHLALEDYIQLSMMLQYNDRKNNFF